jgi:periplasmic divalent cation tolerance protein
MEGGMEKGIMVFTNLPDSDIARSIARSLIDERLAACVNILPAMQSIYRWQGAVEEAGEVAVVIKTTEGLYPQVEAAIVKLHPYDIPEILALPIVAGLPAYLDWIKSETKTR